MEPDGVVAYQTGIMSVRVTKSAFVSILWLTLALTAIVILGFRLQLSFDLSAFFPHKTTLTHKILLEQLKNGPGSRLVVIGLRGGERNQLSDLSEQMKAELKSNPLFVNVLNGDYSVGATTIPEPVKSYYLLQADVDYSRASLQQALQSRLEDLAFGGGATLLNLIARDPFLQTLDILQRLVPANMTGELWFAEDGSAVLLAETRAAAVDIAAQQQAVLAVEETFAHLSDSDTQMLELTGVGAFGVELQKTIRAEVKKRTLLATGVLLMVLLIVYRKLRLLLLATVPIGMGFLAGLAVVTLFFENVHGITLAFGFTLMGVAVDYPLHLFSHSRQSQSGAAIRRIWPTLRIGAISTAIAYLAIALAGSNGLAQLGLFTAVGVIISVLVTRTWLPLLMGSQHGLQTSSVAVLKRPSLILLPAFLILCVALFATHYLVREGLWDDRLSSLSPVPAQRLERDGLLRSAASTPDMRYQLVSNAPTLESWVIESEATDLLLQEAVDDGLLTSWQSVSQVLPSQSRQKVRQDAMPRRQDLHDRLDDTIAETQFSLEAFEPFEANVESTRSLSPLLPRHFENTLLESWLGSHLIQVGDQWVSLVTLNDPKPAELHERIKTWNSNLELIDLHQSSLNLVHDYRNGALKTLVFASLVIITLLLFEHKEVRKILWIALTVITALSVTILVITLMQAGLTIIHLVALLLVMGLGLDYALFFSRTETRIEQQATRHALLACAATTTLTFSILAGSSIPVLKFLGLTVAVGSAASFILAYAGSNLFRRT
jgi:predicted exporter